VTLQTISCGGRGYSYLVYDYANELSICTFEDGLLGKAQWV